MGFCCTLTLTHTAPAPANVDKLLDIDQALVQIRSMKHKWRELAETVRLPETLIEQVLESQVKGLVNSSPVTVV